MAEYRLFRRHVWFAVLIVTTGVAFWDPLSSLARLAYDSDYYSHTVVVPLLAAYLVYRKRKEIFSGSHTSFRMGLPPLFAGLFFFVLEGLGWLPVGAQGRLTLSILSLVLLWMGEFALCYGRRSSLAALFPLLLLLLTVPMPIAAMYDFIHMIRVGSTEVASALFTIFGVPVFHQGFLFALPAVSIEVAKECSGIHSTMALFILTLVTGYLFLRPAWKRVLLLLFVFPIVSLTNGLRIATLALLSEYVDRNILNTSLHREGGILFFLFALGLLLLLVRFFGGRQPLAAKDGDAVSPFLLDTHYQTATQQGKNADNPR